MSARTLGTQTTRPRRTEHDPLRAENAKLVDRIQQLRAALAASTGETAQLRRALAQARAENPRLGADRVEPSAHLDDRAYVRAMLSDPASRNP
jgi:hypothetical protein